MHKFSLVRCFESCCSLGIKYLDQWYRTRESHMRNLSATKSTVEVRCKHLVDQTERSKSDGLGEEDHLVSIHMHQLGMTVKPEW